LLVQYRVGNWAGKASSSPGFTRPELIRFHGAVAKW
jgi:hypothetical protein